MTVSNNFCHILNVASLVFLSFSAAAHPIEDLAEKAAVACSKIDDQLSIEDCGASVGNSSIHAEARKAVDALIAQRLKFINDCEQSKPFVRCVELADWYSGSGISRLNTVTYVTVPPSARR